MTDLALTSTCSSYKPGEPYEPCECHVHDFVAELLGIVSTTGRDFRPEAVKKAEESHWDTYLKAQQAEHKRLKAELAALEAEAARKQAIADTSRALLQQRLRNQRPTVLGNGMTVQYHGCSDCGTTDPGHYHAHGHNGDKICDACHHNYHHFNSVRAYNGASPGWGACL